MVGVLLPGRKNWLARLYFDANNSTQASSPHPPNEAAQFTQSTDAN
jgi:hypothetical protein